MKLFKYILVLLMIVSSTAFAIGYPSRPIRIIVPFGAGTGTDVAVRIVFNQVNIDTGAIFVTENMPGANSLIGIKRALLSTSDGYTLVSTGSTTNSIGSALFKQATYDPIDDFTHIAILAVYPTLLVVKNDSPYKKLDDLLKAAKSDPGKLTLAYSSASMQIKEAVFEGSAGVKFTAVPYKASTEAARDLLGRQTDSMVIDSATAISLISARQVRALVVLGAQRAELLPEIPTIGDTGLPKMILDSWSGIGAPGEIPGEAKSWLVKSVNQALSNPNVREKLAAIGSQSAPNGAIDEWIKEQLTAWRQGATKAGLRPQ